MDQERAIEFRMANIDGAFTVTLSIASWVLALFRQARTGVVGAPIKPKTKKIVSGVDKMTPTEKRIVAALDAAGPNATNAQVAKAARCSEGYVSVTSRKYHRNRNAQELREFRSEVARRNLLGKTGVSKANG